MKRNAIIGTMLLCAVSGHAQINATGNEGALSRAALMSAEGNAQGALDCLRTLYRPSLSDSERESADFLTASMLSAEGRYDTARRAYMTFIDDYPCSWRLAAARKGYADCFFCQGDYESAFEAYSGIDTAAMSATDGAECNYRLGICALAAGDREKARASLTRAAKNATTRAAAEFYLGRLDFEDGNYSSAREHLKLANSASAPGNMTDFYLAKIDFAQAAYSKALSEARAMLRQSSVLNKEDAAEMNRIAGESAFKLGERADATAFLKAYIGSCQTPDPAALYILGVDDFDAGRYTDAIYRLTPVTEQATGALRQSAYLYIGQCLMEQGDSAAAILAFDKAARETEGDNSIREAAFYNYAVARSAGADIPFGSAAETFEEFLRLYPHGPYSDRVAAYLASGYIADKDYDRALRRLNQIADSTDDTHRARQRVLYALGLEAVRAGNLAVARTYLDEAAALSRYDASVAAEVTLAQAQLMLADGDNEGAAAKYQTYLQMAKGSSINRGTAYYGLGYALYRSAKSARAAKAFEEALPLASNPETKADILNRLGDIRFSAGDYAGASERYAQAFAANPSAGDYATLSAARMKGYQKDYTAKLALLEAFGKDFAGSALMPEALLETTQAQINLGRNEDALATYRKLIDTYPRTAQGRRGYLQMAMTLLDMGRREEAARTYRAVISAYPSSDEAAQATTLLKNMYADEGRADEFLRFMAGVANAPVFSDDDTEELSYTSAVAAFRSRGDTSQLADFANRYQSSAHRPEILSMLMQSSTGANAAGYADELIARYPDSRYAEGALRLKAERATAAGDLPAAVALWQQLQTQASDATTATAARLGVMRAARDMADFEVAADAADAIIASSSGGSAISEAKFTKALALREAGKNEQAIAIWQQLAKDPADIFGARGAFEAAETLHEAGNDKQALSTAQALTRSGSPHRYWVARAFILTSDIYRGQGKDFEAKEYLEALRDNYPGTEADIFMMIDSRLQ